MKIDKFSIYIFQFCYNDDRRGVIIDFCSYNEYLGYFHPIYNSLENLQNAIKCITDVLESGESITIPGGQESYIIAKPEYLEFVVTLPGHEEPLLVETKEFLRILEEYEVWLTKLENCEIPGIIPESKLDTWSCVPNEYVRPEYWERLKEAEGESGETGVGV